MAKLTSFFLFIFLIVSGGCVLITKSSQIHTLKELAKSQDQMKLYIAEREESLSQLIKDIEEGQLKKGASYQEIIEAYREPVLTRDLQKESLTKELLYRHPTQYFNTDKVYLYLDQNLNLSSWQYEKAN